MTKCTSITNIIGFAQSTRQYLRATPQGFRDGNAIIPTLDGIITKVTPCAVKWANKKPNRIAVFPKKPLPKGYKKTFELDISTGQGDYGLSVENMKSKANLEEYAKLLQEQGKQMEQVITRLSVVPDVFQDITYGQVLFSLVGDAPERDVDSGQDVDWEFESMVDECPPEIMY